MNEMDRVKRSYSILYILLILLVLDLE